MNKTTTICMTVVAVAALVAAVIAGIYVGQNLGFYVAAIALSAVSAVAGYTVGANKPTVEPPTITNYVTPDDSAQTGQTGPPTF